MLKNDLFSPIRLGALTLKNRIVMAPLTRGRADGRGVVGELTAKYYAQRATAGLIISEATTVSPQAKGYAFTPGIYNEAQIAGWRLVTDAVHAQGGVIFSQLWHVGRVSHPSLQPAGALPVAPSAVRPNMQAYTESGLQECVTPRVLRLDEIPDIINQFHLSAECALKAGFDGVEIHGANGYLLHQFLSEKTNLREDGYGGTIENRARLVLEVTEAVSQIWGASRVGIRLSPLTKSSGMSDQSPLPIYNYLAQQLSRLEIAYLHVIEGDTGGLRDVDSNFDFQQLRRDFAGAYMANNGYDLNLALEALANNRVDLVCVGRPFISNPDLVKRWKDRMPLNPVDSKTLYGGDSRGYTDYPMLP